MEVNTTKMQLGLAKEGSVTCIHPLKGNDVGDVSSYM